jgi:Mlc titration factor MtfA (ptsG expression regulator)
MLFQWLKRRRRRQLLAEPFPEAWLGYLHHNVRHYRFLNDTEKARLRDDLRIFVAEKNWEGCGGLEMTDEIKVTIAAQAMLLVLGMEHNYFDRVQSILVYPHGFKDPTPKGGRDGLIHEGGPGNLGQAWYRGPVVLSWQSVREDGRHPGRGQNVVFHEFAHQLDMLDGVINGTPPLKDRKEAQRWREVMSAEFQRLLDASAQGRATLLDQYGTTNEGEFFAVATECFFNHPVEMQHEHPRLYQLLRDYYRQDTAGRCKA